MVGHHLHLDVVTTLDEGLDEDRGITERRRRLAPGRLDLVSKASQARGDAHATPAAAGRGLDEQGQVAFRDRAWVELGQHRHAGPAASRLDSTLAPIAAMASGDGPIQVRPASMTARANPAFSDRKP